MRESTLKKLHVIIENGNGYIGTPALLSAGLTNRQVAELVELGILEKIAHGQYWLIYPGFYKTKEYKAVEVALVNPNAVICADSACYYQGLISVEPKELSIATRRSDRHKMNMNFQVQRHYYSEKNFEEDCLIRTTNQGDYKIYDVERSVCDCIRFQDDIEKDIFDLVIENYRKDEGAQVERLKAYARAMRVGNKVEKILKV